MPKVLVVDDETIARKSIEILLSKHADIKSISQAENGEKALALMQSEHFDIVFLDIHMPKLNGLALAKKCISETHTTQFIFVTAFDQHAVEAFELNALDYILKPFDDERFKQSVNKAIRQLQKEQDGQQLERMQKVLEALVHNQPSTVTTISLKETGKIKIVDVEDIQFVKGAGNYVEIVLMSGQVLLQRETLKSIQAKLPALRFSRIHKSTIVRNDLITELRPTSKGDYLLSLKTGEKLLMSRRNKDLLDNWLS